MVMQRLSTRRHLHRSSMCGLYGFSPISHIAEYLQKILISLKQITCITPQVVVNKQNNFKG